MIASAHWFVARHRVFEQALDHLDQNRFPLRLVDKLAFAGLRAMGQGSHHSNRSEDTGIRIGIGNSDFARIAAHIASAEKEARKRRGRRRRAVEGSGTRLSPLDALNSAQTNAFLGDSLKNVAPSRIDISWETIEKTLEYKPIEVIDRIAPRALLLIGARDDDLCKIEGYEKLYDRAREPKKLVVLPITHYEIYGGKWLEESSRLAAEWFNRFLK